MFIPELNNKTVLHSKFYLDKFYNIKCSSDLTVEKKHLLKYLDKYGISRKDVKNVIKLEETEGLKKDAYRLVCQDHEVIIQASTKSGMVYGINTFIQVLNEMNFRKKESIPSFKAEDTPRFKWRAIMLDCSSYFIELDDLKKIIELMSVYRLNVLHLKLTGNSSWRLASKRYRKINNTVDRQYSVEEMKELVSFAKNFHVELLPEITLPTHMKQLIDIYPEISCKTDEDNHQHICLTDETTLKKIKALLKETVSIFPFEYIHLGAYDLGLSEFVPCPKCQNRLNELGSDDPFDLISEFMNEIISFLVLCGKKVIYMNDVGHDNHHEDQLIQYRKDIYYVGDEYKLINDKVKIINSNINALDFSSSFYETTLKKLYNFEPISKKVEKKKQKYMHGVEGILWTDHVTDRYQLYEYLFPRVFAFSEMSWTDKDLKSYSHFKNRVFGHFYLLEKFGVKHYTPLSKCDYHYLTRKVNKIFKK